VDFVENIGVLFDKLQTFLRTETVVGEPLQIGKVTIIPVISLSFGAGGGAGIGRDEKGNDGEGGGGGAGAKITPNAIIVVKDDEVSVVPLTQKGSLEKLMEVVPQLVQQLQEEGE
jgi:uncharacterized spore protein YtfJ